MTKNSPKGYSELKDIYDPIILKAMEHESIFNEDGSLAESDTKWLDEDDCCPYCGRPMDD